VLSGIGLREIVLRLRRRAPGELDVNDGVETAAAKPCRAACTAASAPSNVKYARATLKISC
jgi:hypothetical protein